MSLLTQVRGLLTGLTGVYPPIRDRFVSIQLNPDDLDGLQFVFWDDRGELIVRMTGEDLEKDLEPLLEEVIELLEKAVEEE